MGAVLACCSEGGAHSLSSRTRVGVRTSEGLVVVFGEDQIFPDHVRAQHEIALQLFSICSAGSCGGLCKTYLFRLCSSWVDPASKENRALWPRSFFGERSKFPVLLFLGRRNCCSPSIVPPGTVRRGIVVGWYLLVYDEHCSHNQRGWI